MDIARECQLVERDAEDIPVNEIDLLYRPVERILRYKRIDCLAVLERAEDEEADEDPVFLLEGADLLLIPALEWIDGRWILIEHSAEIKGIKRGDCNAPVMMSCLVLHLIPRRES